MEKVLTKSVFDLIIKFSKMNDIEIAEGYREEKRGKRSSFNSFHRDIAFEPMTRRKALFKSL